MEQTLVSISLISTFIFWLIGVTGNWRRTLVNILLSLAAMILAYQHFDALADIIGDIFGSDLNTNQRFALGFGLGLVLAWIVLYVLYTVLWKSSNSSQESPSGGIRLVQSLFTAIIGWVLGVLVAACYLQLTIDTLPRYFGSSSSALWNAFRVTINLITVFVNPWLVHSPPPFLLQLGMQ